jgi:hypothetical protein
MAKEQCQVDPASGSSLLDLAQRIEPLCMALWDAGMPCTLCHALYAVWSSEMLSAAAASRWLTARTCAVCTPDALGAALPGLMQRVAGAGRLDVAAALLASSNWEEERCSQQLVEWAFEGRAVLCRLLLTR